jgi:AcrR family transcriptional regulator
MSIREDFLRPRTDRELAARREAILEAAEALMLESPHQRFSIPNVAKRIGVSQSTIFMHFRNREELLSTLYTRVGRHFFDTFLSRVHEGISDKAFCETFVDTILEFPGFRLMRPMVLPVVEECLNQAFILQGVREVALYRAAAADRVDEILKLKPGGGQRLMKLLVNLMCGAVQVDISKYVETEGADEIVAAAIRSWDFRDSFLDGAELAVRGIRQK